MQKIPTLFLRNPENMKLVTREVNPDAAWVLESQGVPTVKKDGTNVRVTVHNGKGILLEKRRNPTREEKANGAEPGYVHADPADPQDKHIYVAFDTVDFASWPDGTWSCEALGPKIQGGIECIYPDLYSFLLEPDVLVDTVVGRTFDEIQAFLEYIPIEGIVWHDKEHDRMAKIKRRDFGYQWPIRR